MVSVDSLWREKVACASELVLWLFSCRMCIGRVVVGRMASGLVPGRCANTLTMVGCLCDWKDVEGERHQGREVKKVHENFA